MIKVTGIKFKGNNRLYYFGPNDLELPKGTGVIVETARGTEYGEVVMDVKEVEDGRVVQPLKQVLRVATEDDRKQIEKNESRKADAMRIAAEKVEKHKLNMKLVDAEFTFDAQKLVFYFTAEGRVDFRELVRDLASHFRVRIELRQIGIRDECRMLGGIAPCGRVCCCKNHLPDFERVSVKMAKNQSLSINSQKISGLCGRLMCCLSYENKHYVETAKTMPRNNSEVTTPDGKGWVWSNNFLKRTVKVKIPGPNDSFEIKEYPLDQVKGRHTVAEDLEKDDPVDDSIKELLD
ncbi:stage 0 sporulation protein [Clostridia bacterium]|nr:stage 0 sporulation protein [Clostridia bacterium]